jgi:erythromycin esterase-like protein
VEAQTFRAPDGWVSDAGVDVVPADFARQQAVRIASLEAHQKKMSQLATPAEHTVDELKRARAELVALRKRRGEAEQELRNIANAKRYDKEYFIDSGDCFGDWAQSRCRAFLQREGDE